jgi:hypothetical protein
MFICMYVFRYAYLYACRGYHALQAKQHYMGDGNTRPKRNSQRNTIGWIGTKLCLYIIALAAIFFKTILQFRELNHFLFLYLNNNSFHYHFFIPFKYF